MIFRRLKVSIESIKCIVTPTLENLAHTLTRGRKTKAKIELRFIYKLHTKWFLQYIHGSSIIKLHYESSTLILYKELSSPIFQSVSVSQSGIGDICPDLNFVQYIKAYMPSTDPVSSIFNCYRLIVSYTDPVHSFIIS